MNLIERDVSKEEYREIITFAFPDEPYIYRIDSPMLQWHRVGGSTIRILDAAGIVHLVPGPGYRGAIHRWKPRDASHPVQF